MDIYIYIYVKGREASEKLLFQKLLANFGHETVN